ncbi:MAG: molybdopterin-dependent oxidoreductase, partial [Dehalococcoidia bacterium]|nr:molybdopterin-dependent oxidoreductase [Dehalococcoidia bacterium]
NRTTSSRSTYMMGNAVHQAARALAARLRELAAEHLEVASEDLEVAVGVVCVRGAPERCVSWSELVAATGHQELVEHQIFRNEGGLDPETGHGIASSHWHQGAAGAEVEVDPETGQVRVLRLHAAVYAGRVVNDLTAALQNEGSMIMGLGSALFEEVVYDAGQPLTTNLGDYLIPSTLDLPVELSHDLLEHPGAEVHGVGETALPPVPAAIGNAVARATGARLTELPLTPERVLRGLCAVRQEESA